MGLFNKTQPFKKKASLADKAKIPVSLSAPLENICIQRTIPKMKEWKVDTLIISTRKTCATCKIYNQKIYSFYGWNKKYDKLPEFLYQRRCPECDCSIGASTYFPGISSKPKK